MMGFVWLLSGLLLGNNTPKLTIQIYEPKETTTIRIPISWLEVSMDILKVLDRQSDTADTSLKIEWDSLKNFLTQYRGGLLRMESQEERLQMFIGDSSFRCPCLEVWGRDTTGTYRLVANLDLARRFLQHTTLQGFEEEQKKILLKFLEDGRLGEAIEITSTKGDTVHIRIISQVGGKP